MTAGPSNAQVRKMISYQKKRRERDRDDVFVAEGERLVLEVPGEDVAEIYVSASYHTALPRDAERFFVRCKKQPVVVADEVFRRMSDTKTPQGIMALVRQRRWTMEELTRERGEGGRRDNPEKEKGKDAGGIILVLENIQDPGNLGTILRSSEAAGVSGVILAGDTVDRYSPKAVRATMGSIYRVPVVQERAAWKNDENAFADKTGKKDMTAGSRNMDGPEIARMTAFLKKKGYVIAAADAHGTTGYDAYDWKQKTALLIGNEANGLTEEALGSADTRLRIPMEGKNESLNAAVSASVILFEAARQRRACIP